MSRRTKHGAAVRSTRLGRIAALVSVFAILVVAAHGEVVDRIVAVVGASVMAGAAGSASSFVPSGFGSAGGSAAGATVITWSAVFEEADYQAFRRNQEPVQWKPTERVNAPEFRAVLEKMIDQVLLQQELERSAFAPAGSGDVQDQMQAIERKFPDADAYHQALERYHLTEEKLAERLTREGILSAFVDSTLRPQARVTDEQIEGYYQKTLLPELRQRNGASATVPALQDVRAQIEELLAQKESDTLLEQWLQQLRRGTQIEIWPE